ncbi:MAG: V8-like Glu-specific endopeptidase [Bacteroidia bacterium]|jgi:lysyl endopeptidase
MKKTFIILFAVVLYIGSSAMAQVSHGGEPLNWEKATASTFEFIRLPELDMATIEAEDAENDQYKEFGFRFGIEHAVNLNITSSGTWSVENEMNVWRLGVDAPNAKGVSFVFNKFDLPKSAKLFIYDTEKTHYIGSFDYTNKQTNGMLASTLVYGEKVIIELQIPFTENLSKLYLSINQIVHAYRGLNSQFEELKELARGPFGNSGSCNISINCPEGDAWQVEKKSVALIANGGNASCSGALVNNTANDGYPYFLTANHCLGGGVGNWTFYFNHESTTCGGNSGPTNQTVSGATIKASNGDSDFALLEINNGNQITYNVEWAGWDNTDVENAVTAATGIHHPSGDLKKICHDTDGPFHATQGGAAVWYINQWEDGMTEGGSSGSPLFNQEHRIIGQLYGGSASCANQAGADWYGRFGVSWDGTSATSRLRDWLDPQNNTTILDGYPTGAVTYNVDAATSGINDVPEELCDLETVSPVFVLKNNGSNNLTSCTISYNINNGSNQTVNWTGNLVGSATENIQLTSFIAIPGTNTVDVTVSSPNGQTDENGNNNSIVKSFEVNVGEDVLNLTIETDNFGYETYWEVRGPNNQVVASGGNTNVGPNGGGERIAEENDPGVYPNNSTINETIQLDGNGCYTFLIVDDYDDGICCGFTTGAGSYELTDGNNTVMAEGGEFEEDEESEFGMTKALSISEADFGSVSLYPNPSEGTVFIEIQNIDELTGISVIDVMGKTVAEFASFQSTKMILDLNRLADGVYYVNLNSEKGTIAKKLVLLRN